MALLAEVETATGEIATYFPVSGIQILPRAGVVMVTLDGFKDEAARRAGKQPVITEREIVLTFDELGTAEPTRPQIYAAIQARAAALVEKAAQIRDTLAARERAAKNGKRLRRNADGQSEVVDFDETTVMGPVVPSTAEQEVLDSLLLGLATAQAG